jgi:molecular chaperone Hsp33
MIKKDIFGDDLKQALKARAKDRMCAFFLADGQVRGVIVNGTLMVGEMRANHGLGVLETLALGHAYLGVALMSAQLKGNDRISLAVECSGPIKGLYAEANAFNEVRGYLKQVPIPVEAPPESFDLSPFFGAGFLTVTRYLEDAKYPFSGKIMMEYGTVAKDLANYYLTSEQIPTAIHLSIQFDRDGAAVGAGGLLLQAMPDAAEDTRAALEDLVQALPSLGEEFSRSPDLENFLTETFQAHHPVVLDNRRVEFMCHCSQDTVTSLLLMLPPHDFEDILENGPFPLEIRCHNCNTPYTFTRADMKRIRDMRFPNN